MPRDPGVPPGTLVLLILRLLDAQPLHGYAIAQRIHLLSREELSVEEGSLYPALQKLLLNGWIKATWTTSESGREVREYRLTRSGRKQLEVALAEYQRTNRAIGHVLDNAVMPPYCRPRGPSRAVSGSHPSTTRMRGGGDASVRTSARNRPSAAASYGAP
jgi:PadR family transcriptional regulator, regulatory protein PadR